MPDAPPARWRSWLSGLDQLLPPHLQLTLKAALAAGVSWQLAQQLPSSVNQYAYYAPLGAILAIFPTVVSSLKAALQTVLGILLGAGIATAVDTFFPTSAWTVAAVAGGGILVGALRWLGDQRAWVPITALFVFVIGGAASPSYLVGYVVLTLMGAAIGTLVNLLIFPPLHLRESRRALEALREVVVAQLEDLADGLEVNERPDPATWERRTRAISPAVSTMREAVADMARSLRVNPRAARYRRATSTLEREGRALYRIALLVEEMVDLLTEVEQQDMPALPFNRRTRLDCARALQDIASLVENLPDGGHEDQAVRVARAAVDEAEASLAEDPRAGGSDPFVAGSVVTLLRRCLTALPGARSPSPPR